MGAACIRWLCGWRAALMHRARARRRPCATAAAPAADASRARPGGPAVFQRAWRSRPPSGIGCSEVSGCPAILRGNRRGPRERDAARCHSPSRVGRNGGSGARVCRQAVALLDVRQVFGRDLEGESDAVARQAEAVGAQHDGSDLLEQRRPVFACSDADRHRARVPVVPTRQTRCATKPWVRGGARDLDVAGQTCSFPSCAPALREANATGRRGRATR